MPSVNFNDSWLGRLRDHKKLRLLVFSLILVFLLPISAICYLARVRFLRITAIGRIGHLVSEPDTFIKARLLGLCPWYHGVLICPPGIAANECLLGYWKQHLLVVRSPFCALIAFGLNRFSYLQYDVSRYWVAINETAPYIQIEQTWGARPAVLELSENHRLGGRAWLSSLGVPQGAPFVCFHCREEGYSPSDDPVQAYRNSSVENYMPAITELTRRGYWCIRMGDPSMRPLVPMERVIDYAHLDSRSDTYDLFLCASCTFFLASCSGLLFLSSVFGRPVAAANQVPLSTVLAFGLNDIATPKLLWSEKESRYLDFCEVFESDISNFRFTSLYQDHHIRAVENSPEDVLDLALEMLERIEGPYTYSTEDEALQVRFKSLMREGHFSFGGSNRVGRGFLRKYQHLLEDKPKT